MQSSKDWQALLGGPPLLRPPTRTTVIGLLRTLASRGALPSSQLQPALALARGLRVPQGQAGAVAGALAVGWAEATGRSSSLESVVAVLQQGGDSAAVADVRGQLGKLQERWGVSVGGSLAVYVRQLCRAHAPPQLWMTKAATSCSCGYLPRSHAEAAIAAASSHALAWEPIPSAIKLSCWWLVFYMYSTFSCILDSPLPAVVHCSLPPSGLLHSAGRMRQPSSSAGAR